MYVFVGLLLVSGVLLSGCGSSDLPAELPVSEVDAEEVLLVEEVSAPVAAPTQASAPTATTVPASAPAPAPVSAESRPVMMAPVEPMMQAHMSLYKDGSYFKMGNYTTPAGADSITVQLKMENDRIVGVSVGMNATNETSKNYQNLFANGIGARVVGKSLDEIGSLGAVNGSSLTPVAFNQALGLIKAEARS